MMNTGVTFADIQSILDQAIQRWEDSHGRRPNLMTHSSNFGWGSRDQLLTSTARQFRLIQPELVGSADASDANIIKALTVGLPFVRRMPAGGPFLADADIARIEAWIEAGAPE